MFSSLGQFIKISFLFLLIALVMTVESAGALPTELKTVAESIIVDGDVFAVAPTSTTVYIGGNFNHAGTFTGGGVPLDPVSGAIVRPFPRVSGFVSAVISDGTGGWYIGGRFSKVGNADRTNLARILADGTVSSWNPVTNEFVKSMALSGSVLYIAGGFSTVNGQTRNKFAAVNASTGGLLAWNPNPQSLFNNPVATLAVSGSTVYVGGSFDSIGGQTRKNIAALDATTGNAKSWNPQATSSVIAIAVDGSTVYAAGNFTGPGTTRTGIAAIDAATGNLTSWNPILAGTNSPSVEAIVVTANAVYLGGDFETVNGVSRNYIAAVDKTSGAPTTWNPPLTSFPHTLMIMGSTVYVGGQFTTLDAGNTIRRGHLAAYDINTGAVKPWNPNAEIGNLPTAFCLANNGTTIYAGGSFHSMGGVTRERLAAFDAKTGALLPWAPTIAGGENRVVFDLEVGGGNVYLSGDFTSVNGQGRNYLAAVSAATGAVQPWNPSATHTSVFTDVTVDELEISGNTVFASGNFNRMGGLQRPGIASINGVTGQVNPWNPANSGVIRLLKVDGSTVYVGGTFTTIGGASRNRLAALDATTALATAWNPATDVSDNYKALEKIGNTVFAGGYRNAGLGGTNALLVAYDASTGAQLNWSPNPTGSSQSSILKLEDSTLGLIVQGPFWNIGGLSRSGLAAIDPITRAVTSWNQDLDGVTNIADRGDTFYLRGDFRLMDAPTFPFFTIMEIPKAGAQGEWAGYR